MKSVAEKIEMCVGQIRKVKKKIDGYREDPEYLEEEELVERKIASLHDRRKFFEEQIGVIQRKITDLDRRHRDYLFQIDTVKQKIVNLDRRIPKLQAQVDELEKRRQDELPKKYQNENTLDELLTRLEALKQLQAELKLGEPSEEFKSKYPDWESWYA